MSEEIAAVGTTPAGRMWATVLGFILEAFCMVIIALTMRYGESSNTLHSSGLQWAFATCLGVAASLGLSQIATVYIAKKA